MLNGEVGCTELSRSAWDVLCDDVLELKGIGCCAYASISTSNTTLLIRFLASVSCLGDILLSVDSIDLKTN